MTQVDPPLEETTPPDDELIAEPDPGYRWKHLIMAVLMLAAGGWFAYDGWVKWPNANHRAEQVSREKDAANAKGDTARVEALAKEFATIEKHNDASILIQKILAFALPAFGLGWGFWTLRETRGFYRMHGTTLYVPGHPPVGYDDIRRIDKRKWDRKGFAYLHYETPGHPPRQGILKLDDFAYDRTATDA